MVVAVEHVEPRSKVEVKSKTNGIVQALLVDEGEKVKEGQVLAELDKEYLAAQVREAKAALGRAAEGLKHSATRSPIAGVVLSRKTEVNSLEGWMEFLTHATH